MKNLLSFLLSFFFVAAASAQPSIEWQKCFGGGDYDSPSMIIHAQDGGYLLGGEAKSINGDVSGVHGDRDIWLVKIDEAGNIQWQHAYGGSSTEDLTWIEPTPDGGYIILGSTWSNDGDVSGFHGGYGADLWVVKIEVNGAIQWQKAFGGTDWDTGGTIYPKSDGGYIMSGAVRSVDGDVSNNKGLTDIWMVGLSEIGDIQWDLNFGGSNHDIGSLLKTSDGGFLIRAATGSSDGDVFNNRGGWDIWLAKVSNTGSFEWKKTYGGTNHDFPGGIIETSDGGYIMAGATLSNNGQVSGNHGLSDVWVVKLNATGAITWKKTFGGSVDDRGGLIHETSNHEFIVFAYSDSNDGDVIGQHGGGDPWIFKLNNAGEILWQQTLGGTNYDQVTNYLQTSDGGFLMLALAESNNGDVIGQHGDRDYWLVKLSPESVPTAEPSAHAGVLEVFPNPATQSITVKISTEETWLTLSITDLLGREVISQNIQNGSSLDVSVLPNGLYLLSAATQDGTLFLQMFRKQG